MSRVFRPIVAGLGKIAAKVKSATPRAAGVIKQAVTSRVGKIALGAVAVGGGVGLGSYLALSGMGAGLAYGMRAPEAQVPTAPPAIPWQPAPGQPLIPPQYVQSAPQYAGGPWMRLAAFLTSPLVLFILLVFVLAIIFVIVYYRVKR